MSTVMEIRPTKDSFTRLIARNDENRQIFIAYLIQEALFAGICKSLDQAISNAESALESRAYGVIVDDSGRKGNAETYSLLFADQELSVSMLEGAIMRVRPGMKAKNVYVKPDGRLLHYSEHASDPATCIYEEEIIREIED